MHPSHQYLEDNKLTMDLHKITSAKNILLSLESTRRLKAENAPATTEFSFSFELNLLITHKTPLYREFNILMNRENCKESMCPLFIILRKIR